MPASTDEIGSFLAFLYHIRFVATDRQRFVWPSGYVRGALPARQNNLLFSYEQVMDEFKLTPVQRDLMVAVDWAMTHPDPAERAKADELWKQLVMQLIPEFRAWTEGDGYGNYQQRPPLPSVGVQPIFGPYPAQPAAPAQPANPAQAVAGPSAGDPPPPPPPPWW